MGLFGREINAKAQGRKGIGVSVFSMVSGIEFEFVAED